MDKINHWSLDKKVPVALLVAIVVQTVSVVWWAASVSGRIDFLEKAQGNTSGVIERLVRLEVQTEQARQTLEKIDRKLEIRRF